MPILTDAAALVRTRLGAELDRLTIERAVVGLFFTGVKLSGGSGGVSYTPIKDIPDAVCCPSSAGRAFNPQKLRGMAVGEALAELGSREPIKNAVSLATLNAASAACFERGLTGGLTIHTDLDALDAVEFSETESVAVVGALVPVLRRLRTRGGRWWVIEQDPRTLKGDELDHFVPSGDAQAVLADADALVITGVTLLNGTLEQLLATARPEARVVVVGPTASLLPEPLFERGVGVVGGVWVRRPDELLDVLAAAGSGYHMFDRLADRIVIEAPGFRAP